ncbi:MAG: terpene cyclase/mutase family protein [Synergistaceae bacterium]|nr:terpene cyclase/mutase family protein [Synergistaceae bacterium]
MNISLCVNRTAVSLLNMTGEMFRKGIELNRITRTCALLMMSGLEKSSLKPQILVRLREAQRHDGGFTGNTDTLWNIKLMEYFPELQEQRTAAVRWLVSGNGETPGLGRTKRDMHRIPVTGLALYLLPEIASAEILDWLAGTWHSEKNSLTYKAAYTLMAFHKCGYSPSRETLIPDTVEWLISQQQDSGGFAPWKDHPVGENVYFTAVAALGLMTAGKSAEAPVRRACEYLCRTQLSSGIWPYHEIEEGAAWGMFALNEGEEFFAHCSDLP